MRALIASTKSLLFHDQPDWFGPKAWSFLVENPTILVTLAYVFVSALGFLYDFVLYDAFGINIINYAEASDFFLAAFKRPEAFAVSLVLGLTLVLYKKLAQFVREMHSRFRFVLYLFVWLGLFRREILIPLGIAYFFAFFFFAAQIEAASILNEEARPVSVTVRFGEPSSYRMSLIGTTERFVFGFEPRAGVARIRVFSFDLEAKVELVRAIPFTNIVRIEYMGSSTISTYPDLEEDSGFFGDWSQPDAEMAQ